MEESCETCKFFKEIKEPLYENFLTDPYKITKYLDLYLCRRYPPKYFYDIIVKQRYPFTKPDDWCGEYQVKKDL